MLVPTIMVITAFAVPILLRFHLPIRYGYWITSAAFAGAVSACFYVFSVRTETQWNSPLALILAFALFPIAVALTAAHWIFRRRRGTLAMVLSAPVGAALYAAGLFVALIIGVNAGWLTP